MNLFLKTRQLTTSREDHLTCFIAAALEVDGAFREAYASLVLAQLIAEGRTPEIASIETQAQFAEQHSVPDMMLTLADGRRVLCEHKIDAPETLQVTSDGTTVKQLERYLAIPDIAALVYFRSAPVTLADTVLQHERYLHPDAAAHFVWRDLYGPLERGESDIARWLVAGFDHLGFTPPEPHVGALWPGETEEVRNNQRNFGKLWQKTRGHLEAQWRAHQDQRGCELYLNPKTAALASQVYVSPIAQGGTLLRTRIDTDEAHLTTTQRRLEAVLGELPALPDMSVVKKPGGRVFIDLLAPLRVILADAETVALQEERLYAQVVPVVDALKLVRRKGGSDVAARADAGAHRPQPEPPEPHIGRLWPGDTEEVRQNQRNFGKLWHKTRQHLGGRWAIRQDQRGCELYLKPKGDVLAKQVYVSSIAEGGTVLRTRIDIRGDDRERVEQRIRAVAAKLPVQPRVKVVAKSERVYIDLLAPLRRIFAGADAPALQEDRLYEQVMPVIDAVGVSR